VIYKRETAKGRNIIQSEKELLIGLHKYIGYVLHEQATRGAAMGAVLTQDQYEERVEAFLRCHDPYSPAETRQSELRSITKEAGERLVLIVESPAGIFGFELRSIQEFFAACHLTDTSQDTSQRFSRFDAIARLPHWRNVALFFAGRVGRNYSGEASNIIEVCRSIDREGSDRYVRGGSLLALELAADRAFGPNRRLQRSLLELGLEVLEDPVSPDRRREIVQALSRLPEEDVRDHVVPVMERWLTILAPSRLVGILGVLHAIAPEHPILQAVVRKVAESPAEHRRLFETLMDLKMILNDQTAPALPRIVDNLGVDTVGGILCEMSWPDAVNGLRLMKTCGINGVVLYGVADQLVTSRAFVHVGEASYSKLAEYMQEGWPAELLESYIYALSILAEISLVRRRTAHGVVRAERSADRYAELLPPKLREGRVREFVAENYGSEVSVVFTGVLWLLHMLFGSLSESSLEAFVVYCRRHRQQLEWFAESSRAWSPQFSPAIHYVVAAVESQRSERRFLKEVRQVLRTYGGAAGSKEWALTRARVSEILGDLGVDAVRRVSNFGYRALDATGQEGGSLTRLSRLGCFDILDYALVRDSTQPVLRLDAAYIERWIASIRGVNMLTVPNELIIRRIALRMKVPGEALDSLLEWLLGLRPSRRVAALAARVLVRRFEAEVPPDGILRQALAMFGAVEPGVSYVGLSLDPPTKRVMIMRGMPTR